MQNRTGLWPALGVLILLCGLVPGCAEKFNTDDEDGGGYLEGGGQWFDGGGGTPCKAGQDQDMDKIPDTVEGCTKDSDHDKIPDYMDVDSDNDGVYDSVEAGANASSPRDSDGDKTPDFQERDSDGDGVDDGNEDLNGDGKLGCCLSTCGETRAGCAEVKAGECGPGQKCQSGTCSPALDFLCSNGESDPTKKVTFTGAGTTDKDLPTFICRKGSEQGTSGLKQMSLRKDTSGAWQIALEPTSTYGTIAIKSQAAKEAGASFDLKGTNEMVSGFILSIPSTATSASVVVNNLVSMLTSLPGRKAVTILSSGTPKTSHDNFSNVVSTQVKITMTTALPPAKVRNDLFPTWLGKQVASTPPIFGPSATDFHLQFQTLIRSDGRVIVMGAVATTKMVQDSTMNTAIHMEDLSNGTGLALPSNSATVECDPFILEGTPVADIIWVVDESGSMDNNRKDVANNAKDFFARAIKSGLDFRMGVTNVCSPSGSHKKIVGKFCSSTKTASSYDGGTDRFLLPSEQAIFEACIKNPPGYEGGSEYGLVNAEKAVTNHLPRALNDQAKIGSGAVVVVIVATDEVPQSISSKIGSNKKKCALPSSNQSKVNTAVLPYINLFGGKNSTYGTQAQAVMHLIGGVCSNKCNADVGHGYNEVVDATKGTKADVCQSNLGTSMQIIIDMITGLASPAKLQYVPISASIAVAIDNKEIPRSLTKGFYYSTGTNTLVFVGVPFPKGSQVAASYRRWVAQKPVQ